MDSKAKPFVLSVATAASISLSVAFAIAVIKRSKQSQKDAETSKLAESAVNAPFSATEWYAMTRNRNSSTAIYKDGGNEDDASAYVNIPQQPVMHPTMGGIAGRPETICLIMVGLPGRGKTAIAARTARYLNFFHGLECELFNVGNRRRSKAGYLAAGDYGFDQESIKKRKLYSDMTLNELKLFLLQSGRIAIFDASNVTSQRRLEVYSEIKKLGKVDVIFVEVISSETMVNELEMAEEDAAGSAAIDSASVDYEKRVGHYEKVYEPIASGPRDEDHEHSFSYIKCIDRGKQIILNKIDGYMPGRIAQFITNCCHCHWTTHKKSLYLSRHGQSHYNASGRIGGDSDLTPMGERYALALRDYSEEVICTSLPGEAEDRHSPPSKFDTEDQASAGPTSSTAAPAHAPARLWTSTLKRTRHTARHIRSPTVMVGGSPWIQMKPRVWSNLDEIYAGACDGMTYEEIKERFPKETKLRSADKLSYRYPRGESYLDVIQRLEPLVQEIERHRESLLIVGHQGVLRMIYAFYAGIAREDAPHQELKLNHVTVLTPHAYGCGCELVNLLEKETPADDGQKHH